MDKVYAIWFTNNKAYEEYVTDLVCVCATKEAAYARLEEMTQAIDDLIYERHLLTCDEYEDSNNIDEYGKRYAEYASRAKALLDKYNIPNYDIDSMDFFVRVMDLIH